MLTPALAKKKKKTPKQEIQDNILAQEMSTASDTFWRPTIFPLLHKNYLLNLRSVASNLKVYISISWPKIGRKNIKRDALISLEFSRRQK